MTKLGRRVWRLVAVAAIWPAAASSQETSGRSNGVRFETSARSSEAREIFQEGVAALHDYWFVRARQCFREAQRLEPSFALAYWGEAKSHYMPLWLGLRQDRMREALSRLPDPLLDVTTLRERAYLEAITLLAEAEEPEAGKKAYARAMETVARRYPEDIEAKAFWVEATYGAVLLSRAEPELFERMAAVTRSILMSAPDHPGGLHLLLHALDAPERAWRGLADARRYAALAAPHSSHALHMPSHIYLQLGMWSEVVEANVLAWNATKDWVASQGLSKTELDFHPVDFLIYGQLQRGQISQARDTIAELERLARELGEDASWLPDYLADKKAAVLVESESWESLPSDEVPSGVVGERNRLLAKALQAIVLRDGDRLEAVRKRLDERVGREPAATSDASPFSLRLRITKLEVEGAALFAEGRRLEGIRTVREAVRLLPLAGHPWESADPIKPPSELLGELLLEAGLFRASARAFEEALARRPARRLALRGLARALERGGDHREAARLYRELSEQLASSSPPDPLLEEARRYLR